MFHKVYQFQNFRLHIFHQAAVSECADMSFTNPFSHITAQGGPEEEYRYSFTLSLTPALDQDACSTPHRGRFPLGKETWYPLYRRLGWSQVQSGRCGKFIHAGFWTTNCPSSSKLLYWLHCLCHPSLM